MKTVLDQLMVLRDLAPEAPQTRTDDPEERDRRRFYTAAYDAVPKLHSWFSAAPRDLDIERFRQIRRVVRAAQAWSRRAPDTEADLGRELEIACQELLASTSDA